MANRMSSPYISLLLPFPDKAAEACAIPHEPSAAYMHFELDKGEIQKRHNAYMTTRAFAIGTQSASKPRSRARVRAISPPVAGHGTPRTLADLLTALSGRDELAKQQAMIRSTAAHLTQMLALPAERISLDQLPAMVCRFKRYLQDRRHKPNAVRSYVYFLRLITRVARELGWRVGQPEIPVNWEPIYRAATARKCGRVVRDCIEGGIEPSTVGDEELERWAETAMASGLSHSRATVVKHLFRKAIFDAGLNALMPRLSRRKRNTYGIPVRSFPPGLRSEVDQMMRFKTADFVADAEGKRTQLRPESARTVVQVLGRIYGFAVARAQQINALDDLVSRPIITAFADWCINDRKLRPDPVRCALYAVEAAYSQFRGVDLPWFRNLLMRMPKESDKTIVRRKAKKWVDYDLLEQIPAKIRAAADTGHYSGKELAIMRRDELLVSMVTSLPWRQRNLREIKLGTGTNGANIFKEELHPLSTCAKTSWVVDALKTNPREKFWQVRFDESATKARKEVEFILSQKIGSLLDDWIQVHRPLLVWGADPSTLFLNTKGRAISQKMMTETIGELTLRYGGRRVTPHILRDIFTVGFLKDNPEQYETAAKILWHSNPAMIRQRYGANFDESYGAVAAEQWLAERKKK